MKKSTKAISLMASLAVSVSAFSGTVLANENGVAISAQNFPNQYFRDLISEKVDTDGDGFISDEENCAFTRLSINGEYQDFSGEVTGIEYLYGLDTININNVSGLTELDLWGLDSVYDVTCVNTPDLSKVYTATSDSGSSLIYLTLENTNLSSIDVSKCSELTGLILTGNSISSVDLTNNTELDFVDFSGTNITSIDFSANQKLLTAYNYGYYDDNCSRSGYPSVAYFYNGDEVCIHLNPDTEITNSGIAVDATNFPNDCFRNIISEQVDLNGDGILTPSEINSCEYLNVIDYDNHEITDLTGIELLTSLCQLEISGCAELPTLDVSNIPSLRRLDCTYNPGISSLILNEDLSTLILIRNDFSELDLSACPNLSYLGIWMEDELTSLDISNNPELEHLSVVDTGITSLDISNNPNLIRAYNEGDRSGTSEDFITVSYTLTLYDEAENPYDYSICFEPDTEIICAYTSTWMKNGNIWNYYDEAGNLATGWKKIDGSWYYFTADGAMTTGWQKVNGVWYYLRSSGAMATGWVKYGNSWYYLNSSGAMATGWQKINGTWYYLKSSGAMATGWQNIGGTWYYLKSSGAMATGWQKIGNNWYFFYSTGAMAANTTVNGYTLSSNGAMI